MISPYSIDGLHAEPAIANEPRLDPLCHIENHLYLGVFTTASQTIRSWNT
jgi:hypothetical protein